MAKRPEMLNKRNREKVSVFTILLCVVLACVVIGNFWFNLNFSRVVVDGESMEQTLYDGDVLYLQHDRTVKRGDIVVIDVTGYPELFPPSENKNQSERFYIIKRVIALGGDSVYYHDGNVWLKQAGETEYNLLDEPYAYISRAFERDYRTDVREGEVFFLGDNRRSSKDSSRVGCLLVSDIVGVVAEWSIPNHS